MSDVPAANEVCYTCRYAPTELLRGFGVDVRPLDEVPESTERADDVLHAGVCGFGRSVVEAALSGGVRDLVLVNCCDVMRRSFEVIEASGACRFVYLLDLPHCADACARDELAASLARLRDAYAEATGATFDLDRALASFEQPVSEEGPYVGVLGVRASGPLTRAVATALPLPVRNLTCLGARDVVLAPGWDEEVASAGANAGSGAPGSNAPGSNAPDASAPTREEAFLGAYAAALLGQMPCARMGDPTSRRRLVEDPNLRGIVYHTVKFCDYYGAEYASVAREAHVPVLRLESDYTSQGEGQLRTRIEAFGEEFAGSVPARACALLAPGSLVAGIDSGSTSTDVVIMDTERRIVAATVIPTQGSASASAEKSLEEACRAAGIAPSAIARTVATGYGRDVIGGDTSVTEITCHARGAHFLEPQVRSVIDIGGQDSKAISLDEQGNVKNFAMNDKCAAGTGRFLEMMARTLGISLEEMSAAAAQSHRSVTISSTCTVFAESEVVSLVAKNVAKPDIIAALDRSVATRTVALAKRVGAEGPCMMTGGVAKNAGVVAAIEERLGSRLVVRDDAQVCGAIGAALFALEGAGGAA